MAENMVVKEPLTADMIDAGEELIRKLDDLRVPTTAALWLFDPEVNDDWRLLFASPDVGEKGPLAVYRQIQLALEQVGDKAAAIPFVAIGLLDADAELVRRLRTAVRTGDDISRIRFRKRIADGHYIEDALIYRVA